MSEQDTYVRAKLTEISGGLERLTTILNRMIEVISKFGETQEAVSGLASAVEANSSKIDELVQMMRKVALAGPVGGQAAEERSLSSSLQAVLDTLDSQIREGAIASDVAVKLNDAAETFEQKGGGGPLIVRIQRWTRILRTYGRVDPISPTDLKKLREDMREWQREVAKVK